MQTFMTRASFGKTAADLDDATLLTQMKEAMRIFDYLTGASPEDELAEHPVMRMWEGFEYALGIYAMMLNLEWTFQRGFADHTVMKFFYTEIKEMQKNDVDFVYEVPPWLGDTDVIKSHRSSLARRQASQYKGRWKVAPVNWPILWPRIDLVKPDGYTLWITRADRERMKVGQRALPPKAVLERIVNW